MLRSRSSSMGTGRARGRKPGPAARQSSPSSLRHRRTVRRDERPIRPERPSAGRSRSRQECTRRGATVLPVPTTAPGAHLNGTRLSLADRTYHRIGRVAAHVRMRGAIGNETRGGPGVGGYVGAVRDESCGPPTPLEANQTQLSTCAPAGVSVCDRRRRWARRYRLLRCQSSPSSGRRLRFHGCHHLRDVRRRSASNSRNTSGSASSMIRSASSSRSSIASGVSSGSFSTAERASDPCVNVASITVGS